MALELELEQEQEQQYNEGSVTLIPIPLDGSPVMYHGIDYTINAQKHRIKLDGNDYYVRRNCSVPLLESAISASLEQMVRIIKPSMPLTIKLTLEENSHESD